MLDGLNLSYRNRLRLIIAANIPEYFWFDGDDGKDGDDEAQKRAAITLHRAGLIRVIGTSANLYPAVERARLVLGTYEQYGVHDIPVAIGTDMGRQKVHSYEFDVPYLADPSKVHKDSVMLFRQVANGLPPNSVHFVGMCGFENLLIMLRDPYIWSKVKSVTLMSGIEKRPDGNPVLDPNGLLVPDRTANNNFHWESTKELYRLLQILGRRHGKTLTIVPRDAPYALKNPVNWYLEHLGRSDSAAERRLYDIRLRAPQELWRQASLPLENCELPEDHPEYRWLSPGPAGKPNNLDWARRLLLGGRGQELTGTDDIRDHLVEIGEVAEYDAVAFAAALPFLQHLFRRTIINSTTHIIGLGPDAGVVDTNGARQFLQNAITTAMKLKETSNPSIWGESLQWLEPILRRNRSIELSPEPQIGNKGISM